MSECSESAYRGLLSSLPALYMALGIVVTYAFGSFLPWDDLAYFCSAFSVLLFSAMITMPRLEYLPGSPKGLVPEVELNIDANSIS